MARQVVIIALTVAAWKSIPNHIYFSLLNGMIFVLCFISAEKQTTFTDYILASLLSVRASQSGWLHSSINHTTIAY